MKLKGLSLGQIRDSFAYHSIEKLMWSTKQPCSSNWGKLWLSRRKKVLFFCQLLQEGKGHAFILHLEDKLCHNFRKARFVNGWQQQFLAGNFFGPRAGPQVSPHHVPITHPHLLCRGTPGLPCPPAFSFCRNVGHADSL